MEASLMRQLAEAEMQAILAAAERYGEFLGLRPQVTLLEE
jgi:hypothetical protein